MFFFDYKNSFELLSSAWGETRYEGAQVWDIITSANNLSRKIVKKIVIIRKLTLVQLLSINQIKNFCFLRYLFTANLNLVVVLIWCRNKPKKLFHLIISPGLFCTFLLSILVPIITMQNWCRNRDTKLSARGFRSSKNVLQIIMTDLNGSFCYISSSCYLLLYPLSWSTSLW